jgi:ABC-type branched-subunit amino acid transport system ATPase component/sugar phosphate permease
VAIKDPKELLPVGGAPVIPGDHITEIHQAEQLVDEVEGARDRLRADARAALGVTGVSGEKPTPLRATLQKYGLTLYPLIALGALAIVDTFQGYAFSVLAPDISRALGISKGAIAAVLAVKTLAIALAPLPIAALVEKHPRRALVCLVTAFVWTVAAFSTGFVVSIWGLLFVLVIDGLSTGSTSALHQPLVMDSYPPESRVRALSTYSGANSFGNVLAPLIVALLAGVLGYTWRGVFVVMGVLSLAGTLVALRLRDPGFGRWDTDRIREQVRAERGSQTGELSEEDVALGFFEIVRRLFLIPSIRRLLLAVAVVGILLIPYQTFLFFFLEERWGLGPGPRGLFFAFTAASAIVALAVFGKRGERLFREEPAKVLKLSGTLLAVGVVLIALGGASPYFWLMIALFGGSSAVLALLNPILFAATLSIIPSNMRPHASALIGIFLGGVGGVIGAIFLGGIDRRYGIAGSLISLLIPGVVGALILRTTGKFMGRDLDRMIDEIIEDEEIKRIKREGAHLPMLACRGIDFSYGQLQVLFDVDFTVDDGEMVALLGVNGAGKSTLLRVVSGLGLPTKGSVRYRGQDITYLDAERRLRLGITQVPGGRAVFGNMTITENMRLFGYSLGADKGKVDAAIERSFDAFPRLHERRNQLANTLSGGEQQMLGLSKALILHPRLLVIDELSLGLAPVIVGQLLDMVRRINADGTAVVLVEQSVNIALSLVDHAYFMEKGQIRFDGAADDLLGRDDLLRAVFLEGASKGAGG